MKTETKIKKAQPQNMIINLFIVLFYISFIQSYSLLGVTAIGAIVYATISCRGEVLSKFVRPVIPFVILMVLPTLIRYILKGHSNDMDFTVMIIGKVLISSIILGSFVGSRSATSLVEGILELGLPQIFNRILALTFRYFHMVNKDVGIGRRALVSRGIGERRGFSHLGIIGEWIGGFFLKSTHHGEMVFNAMKSRGFQGDVKGEKSKDKTLLVRSCMLILFLTMILIIDGKVKYGN